jgi:hypothetical protein
MTVEQYFKIIVFTVLFVISFTIGLAAVLQGLAKERRASNMSSPKDHSLTVGMVVAGFWWSSASLHLVTVVMAVLS